MLGVDEYHQIKIIEFAKFIESYSAGFPWTDKQLRRIYAAQTCGWQGSESYHGHSDCDQQGLRAVYALGVFDGRMDAFVEAELIHAPD